MSERPEPTAEQTLAAPSGAQTRPELAMDETVAGPGTAASIPSATRGNRVARGDVVGRYVVLAPLGAGAMGVVHAAYDPELDRKVALKLLHAERTQRADASEGRTRLLREAQALAKLSHPNVVAIHDVGEHEGRVWLAMEHVEGETLAAWWRREPRSWREVLEVCIRAGTGLAAAHERGLLHRDFKPDNVMVGHDGRVRVMDFGLARTNEPETATNLDVRAHTRLEPEPGVLASPLTQAGALLGTPAYMAPEQLGTGVVAAAADQFSFCVTLWEGLFGERPFAGATLVELAGNLLEGRIRPVPPERKVPAWLRRICLRGLRTAPSERWPGMDALLAQLSRGQARARLRGLSAVAAVVLACGLGVDAWGRLERAERTRACEAAGEEITAVWNAQAQDRVRDGLLATGVSYAATTAERVMPWLDAHANAWAKARTDACIDATVRGEGDRASERHATWCLEERRLEFEALVAELSRADAKVVQEAVKTAAALTRVEVCRDARQLSRQPEPPVEGLEEARAIREDLSRARAAAIAGKPEAGLAEARAAVTRAQALGWPPLVAEAGNRLGAVLVRAGHYSDAESTLERAYFEAARAGAPDVAVDASMQLEFVVGYSLARPADGLRWAGHTDVLLAMLGDDGHSLRAANHTGKVASVQSKAGAHAEARSLNAQALAILERELGPAHPDVAIIMNNLGNVHLAMGELGEAQTVHERALAIREHALGPDHPDVAASLGNLALVHHTAGDHESAALHYARAIEIQRVAFGPDHPALTNNLNNLAGLHYATGAYDQAKAGFREVLAIRERTLGPDHPDVAASLNNLALIHRLTDERAQARTMYERALAIIEKRLGPDHVDSTSALINLGTLALEDGEFERAAVLYGRTLAIREKNLGPDHPDVATSLTNLGEARYEAGAYAEAEQLFSRAQAIRDETLEPEHADRSFSQLGLARVALAENRPGDAISLAEQALALREQAGVAVHWQAGARFVLARALWESGQDRARARDLAAQSLATYESTPGQAREQAQIEQWLERHPDPGSGVGGRR